MNITDTIIFIHIPKTAGNTLRYIIYKQFDFVEILNLYTEKPDYYLNFDLSFMESVIKEKKNTYKDFKIVIGHYKFGLHNFITPKKSVYITFIRNPYNHFISMYNHLISDSRFWSLNQGNSGDISAFANLMTTHNMQTFLLSGISNQSDVNYNSNNALEKAINNIEQNFIFIGLTEFFDESLIVLRHKLKFKNIYYFKHNVKNSNKLTLSEETVKQINEKIAVDYKLYNYAKDRLYEEIKQIPFFKFQVFSFKFLNFIYVIYHQLIHTFQKIYI